MSLIEWSTLHESRFCLCGASLTVRSSPAEVGDYVLGCFDAAHLGDGCGPATREQAAKTRRRPRTAEAGDAA